MLFPAGKPHVRRWTPGWFHMPPRQETMWSAAPRPPTPMDRRAPRGADPEPPHQCGK